MEVERRGNQSSLTEYKGGTIVESLPINCQREGDHKNIAEHLREKVNCYHDATKILHPILQDAKQ